MSSDLTFITNEPGKSLRDRFGVLLGDDTRFFDCLVGYFFISGFYKLYPALERIEKIRILVGLQTDRTAYELLQRAKEQGELIQPKIAQRFNAGFASQNGVESRRDGRNPVPPRRAFGRPFG